MTRYKGYFIDLDGTMYRGQEQIEGAKEFVQALCTKNIPYLFITNNSTQTPVAFANKLRNMGIPATKEQVLTSALATAKYISHIQKDARCMVIGEAGLYEALKQEKITVVTEEDCDFVVIGLDQQVTYEKLAKACLAVRKGAKLISTNADVAIPTEMGFVPGNGAITSVISVSTGIKPIFIGKPEAIIMKEALAILGLAKEETLMVGDNYQTDILAGIKAGIDTLMVFTGVTPYEDYPSLPQKPTYYVHHLMEWLPRI